MRLICPECKNEIDISAYPGLAKDQVIECNICGISLLVTEMGEDDIQTEIVDEGK